MFGPEGLFVRLSGPVMLGTADEFERVLETSPNLERVILDFDAGVPDEVYKIADRIKQRELDTSVEITCDGMCPIAFIAGKAGCLVMD